MLIEWSERVLETFGNAPNADVKPVKELLEELEFIKSDGVWEDVGEMTAFPYTSQTLLKGDGYRDLPELYRQFTAYVPFFEELQSAIDNKDIAKLYEYWTFFRLVDELGAILGRKGLKIHVLPAGELSESGDVYALFDNGWRLYYNKRLTPGKWSYSVTLRPDFSLFTGSPSSKGARLLGVFDAKFKLDVVDKADEVKNFDELDENAEKTGKYETWAKLEDIYKMHAYRDALSAKFAVVLYPGSVSRLFPAKIKKNGIKGLAQHFRGLSKEEMLLCLLVYELVEGTGYLKFRPKLGGEKIE